jgi:hypothetical protein
VKDPRLISVREFFDGDPLYVPPELRKSLNPAPRKVERDLFSDLVDEEDSPAVVESSDLDESECDED